MVLLTDQKMELCEEVSAGEVTELLSGVAGFWVQAMSHVFQHMTLKIMSNVEGG